MIIQSQSRCTIKDTLKTLKQEDFCAFSKIHHLVLHFTRSTRTRTNRTKLVDVKMEEQYIDLTEIEHSSTCSNSSSDKELDCFTKRLLVTDKESVSPKSKKMRCEENFQHALENFKKAATNNNMTKPTTQPVWNCLKCTFENSASRSRCKMCNNINEEAKSKQVKRELNKLKGEINAGLDSNVVNILTMSTPWSCSCSFINDVNPVTCECCGNDKEGMTGRPKRNNFDCDEVSWTHFAYANAKNLNNVNNLPFVIRKDIYQGSKNLIAKALREGILDDFEHMETKFYANKILKEVKSVTCTYFKSHLNPEFIYNYYQILNELVPNGFMLRPHRRACSSTIIAFYNIEDGICVTHYDQDPSVLYLLNGSKEIFLAPKSIISRQKYTTATETHSTILENICPFDLDYDFAVSCGWKKVKLEPGDALSLPKGCIHSVKSSPGTIALSFQTQREHTPRAIGSKELLKQLVHEMKKTVEKKDKKYNNVKSVKTVDNCKNKEPTGMNGIKADDGHTSQTESTRPRPRHSTRKKRVCGINGCNNGFLTNGVSSEMYVLLRRDDVYCSGDLAYVPVDLPQHLICTKCQPVHIPNLVFIDAGEQIRDCYMYERASQVDYENHAEHGANGNILSAKFGCKIEKSG